jgi:hypothetical protein
MENDLDPPGMFRECLAQYVSYMGLSGRESDILKVSFQFLSKRNDYELDEFMGLIQNQPGMGSAARARDRAG